MEICIIVVEVDGFFIVVVYGEGLWVEGGWVVGGFGMRERGEKGDKGEIIVRLGIKIVCLGRVGVFVWFGIGLGWYGIVVVVVGLMVWCVVCGVWVWVWCKGRMEDEVELVCWFGCLCW